jgi:outer membrane immunogenic protein
MSGRSNKLFNWLNLSAIIVTLSICTLSALGQQITTSTDSSEGSSAKSGKSAPSPSDDFSWKGVYFGGHVGYGWGQANTKFNPLPDAATFINLAPTSLKVRPKGFQGGIQGGYNFQFGHVVVGGEADISFSDLKDTKTQSPIIQNNGTPFSGSASFITASQKTKWFGTVRPRVGVAFNRFLVYGTAGLAYGSVRDSADTDFRPLGTVHYPASASKTATGWTAGAGVEIAINKHFSVKTEYLYYDLGKTTITADPSVALPPYQVRYNWENKANTWNSGVNFRW